MTAHKLHKLAVVLCAGILCSTAALPAAWAQTAPTLGTAEGFAVLGASAVTNTGPSLIRGDLGVSPGTAVTGFPPGLIVPPGTLHASDAVAMQAQMDVITAYNALLDPTTNPCPSGHDLTGQDLGGRTLTAGVYCFASSAQLTGTLTLNAEGNASAVFIFQIGSSLTTAVNANVRLINGAQACKVFWQVGSSATFGTFTSVVGNVLALTSITATTGASVNGRLLARTGAVTLDTNSISPATCTVIACVDITAPKVSVTQLIPGPPGRVLISVRDTGSGLMSIATILATNTAVSIPVFTAKTKSAVTVTATKVTEGLGSVVGLKVTDACGNVTVFDPVDFTIGGHKTVTLTGIPQIEHYVTIVNEDLYGLIITVNGQHVRNAWLKPNTTRTINIGAAMVPGDDNTITFEALGRYREHAVVLVHPK